MDTENAVSHLISDPLLSESTSGFAAMLEKLRARKGSGKQLDLSRFSWKESQEMLKDFKGDFSDLLKEERNTFKPHKF